MTQAIVQQQEVARRPLRFTAFIGYGLGDFGCNLAFTLGSTFLLYYYTDVAGLSAAAVGTMFFVVRLWDAFTDLIAGRADHDPVGQVPPVHPLLRGTAAADELPDLPRAERVG
jgi:MFS/sugar transport protein